MKKTVKEVFHQKEISLIDLFQLFKGKLLHIYISVAITFVVGVLIAITSPIEYEADAVVLSEAGSAGGGPDLSSLSGLAGLAGLALPQGGGGASGELGPDMYATIASSQPFLSDLMQEKFYFQEKGRVMSLYEYFIEERPGHIFEKFFNFFKSLPGRFFALFEREKTWETPQIEDSSETGEPTTEGQPRKSKAELFSPKIISLSFSEKYVIGELNNRIKINPEGRLIVVKAKMPEPYVSAQLTSVVLKQIIEYVIAYKTAKQRENLEFIEERTKEAKEKFNEAQLRLAAFRDANQGIISQRLKTIEQQLDYEFTLAFNVYNGLAQQLEQTKIQLKEETPLFSEFQPIAIPNFKASPNVPKIITFYIFIGIFFGGISIIISILRSYLKEIKSQPQE